MTVFIRKQKKWAELSSGQKAGVMLLPLIQVTLLVTALRDIRRRPPDAINGSKRLWMAVAFVNFVGPIAYFVFGRKR